MQPSSFPAVALVFLAALSAAACDKRGDLPRTAAPVEPAAPSNDARAQDTVRASGLVMLDEERGRHVYSSLTGRATKVSAALGQHVRQGELLATIDVLDADCACDALAKAQADVIAAERSVERQRQLHAAGEPLRDLGDAEDAYRAAKAELERARLRRQTEGPRLKGPYTLLSPVDGNVLARNLEPGAFVVGQYDGDAGELFTVGTLDPIWVLAEIAAPPDRARLHVGMRAIARPPGDAGVAVVGAVAWIAPLPDAGASATRLRCTFENPEGLLQPGMTVALELDATPPPRGDR